MTILKEFKVKAVVPYKEATKIQTRDIKIRFTEEEWSDEELRYHRIEEVKAQVTADIYQDYIIIQSLD